MARKIIQVIVLLNLGLCLSGCVTTLTWISGSTSHSIDRSSLMVKEENGSFKYFYDDHFEREYFFFTSQGLKEIRDSIGNSYIKEHIQRSRYSGKKREWIDKNIKQHMVRIEGYLPLYYDIPDENFFPNEKCVIWPSCGDPYVYIPEKRKSYIKTDVTGKKVKYEDVYYMKIKIPIINERKETIPGWLFPIKIMLTPVTLAIDISTLPMQIFLLILVVNDPIRVTGIP
ncbi:MAG: hypothetical protein D6732_19720 [Methanobacteriota archaeon]|nr:MAG: hypothetical protein D6732_19720 [Euryarchaeota archaeon]